MTRVNAFADLDDFAVKTTPKPIEKAQIDQLAAENGFPSRQPPTPQAKAEPVTSKMEPAPLKVPGRTAYRYTTGRNRQINIKATPATVERLYSLADREQIPLGALLERALDAFEASQRPGPGSIE